MPETTSITQDQANERLVDKTADTNKITTVNTGESYHEVCTDAGWCFGLDKKYELVPEEGHTITTYGGFGRPISGIDYDGIPVYYKTKAEMAEEHRVMVEEMHTRYKAEYEADKDRLAEELKTLPALFQERINYFLAEDPDWAWAGMGMRYEQFALVQAAKIHDHFNGDAEAINAWRMDDDWVRQSKNAPDFDPGMSGNQFGWAGMMAEQLARGVRMIPDGE